ncbi:hypothetical protein [uncultured Duncaniella sp.]|uniref:hypothetical protein n=1 Tax=uncultured Duncaniella sp. TaxID=2768039 RepID=UPI00262838A9|nr:hypothetical protein [uncultured Duncaniella sp.]
MVKTSFAAIAVILILSLSSSCIEDGIDSSPSSQPVFSVDTLDMGHYFTGQLTPTSRFMVYNRCGKVLNISDISLRGESSGLFRVNVDGYAGVEFHDVQIRPGDSIYVFVDAMLPANSDPRPVTVEGHVDFVTNGVTSTVVLKASGQDVVRKNGVEVVSDETWDATYPYQIFDSLVVAHGATLRLLPGTKLCFHDKSYMRVYGSLVTEGVPGAWVEMAGDRMGNVVGGIPFDLMASQWDGLHIAPESSGNRLSHTIVRNTVGGVLVDSLAEADFLNCRIRNSAGYALSARYAGVRLVGCEVADASLGALSATGGVIEANHCTFANYYLFTAPRGPVVQIYHYSPGSDDSSGLPYLKASITNSILYGLGTDFSVGDLSGTDVVLRSCVMKSAGRDDENFVNCMWDTDPMYAVVREEYIFDYRLADVSPALSHADASLTLPDAAVDYWGCPRFPAPRPGAYQNSPE